MDDVPDGFFDDNSSSFIRPPDPRPRLDPADAYPLTPTRFDYRELRPLIESERGRWDPGSPMHSWADRQLAAMDRNEQYESAWRVWAEPHQRDLDAGDRVSDAVSAAVATVLAGHDARATGYDRPDRSGRVDDHDEHSSDDSDGW